MPLKAGENTPDPLPDSSNKMAEYRKCTPGRLARKPDPGSSAFRNECGRPRVLVSSERTWGLAGLTRWSPGIRLSLLRRLQAEGTQRLVVCLVVLRLSVILASLAVHVFFCTRLTDSGIHYFSFVFTVPWTSQLFSVNNSCAEWFFGGR